MNLLNTKNLHKFQVDRFFSVPILFPSTAEMTRLVAGEWGAWGLLWGALTCSP